MDTPLSEERKSLLILPNFLMIITGMTYPQLTTLDEAGFKAYFLSHVTLVLLDKTKGEVLGTYYIKPNFPGRCSHICNAGFLVPPNARGNGAGRPSYLV